MRLTLKTDYALRTLLFLGQQQSLVSIAQIAQAHAISEHHLIKVVHALGRLGFVDTLRGKGGGIRLAPAALQATVGQIVRAMEDDLNLVACFGPQSEDNRCLLTGSCRLQGVLHSALQAFMAELDGHTLADLLGAAVPAKANSTQPISINRLRPAAPVAAGDHARQQGKPIGPAPTPAPSRRQLQKSDTGQAPNGEHTP
ncbi:Rrf2 family transcriptional regulator [Vandammella animalimorsus]|uniref:Rrf2 family transcriptional regulator n=1 Tax=Vandammella animalimorsus TaxID=2029117 RepID=A0A2A2A7D2_9BURK|nr:Rrf2 family transcriptional regulator [Vandammella animalimorsus]PAT33682.1 Rrf2 family transcriptional regulator [Vandammella animalimorsus]PAT43242.1 Rrf2 family transcriptional regulator [Vandammella animalimorsus]